MRILNQLKGWIQSPAALSIGNFDGVHLGHQKVIRHLVASAKHLNGISAVITFRNHPLEIFHPNLPVERLCTSKHKEKILSNLEVDVLFHLAFTKKFSKQDPKTFLQSVKKAINYKQIILGYDARIGQGRKGDKTAVIDLSQRMHFDAKYLEPFYDQGLPISSSRIREVVKKGDFSSAARLLGRPFSIYSQVIPGENIGQRLIGFPTANLDVAHLCLPPYGVYSVDVRYQNKQKHGIANLGFAPTVRRNAGPLLEVHILEDNPNLYGQEIEVIFKRFLRPERKFETIEQLRRQIELDLDSLQGNA